VGLSPAALRASRACAVRRVRPFHGVASVAIVALIASACGGSAKSSATPAATGDAPPGVTATAFFDTDATATPATAGTAAGTATSVPPTPAITERAACASARPHAAGDSDETMPSGGIDRTYILHVPPSYDGTRQTPLVLNLHGFGSNARQQAIYSGFPAKGDREGFIVVTPDGTGEPRHWNYPGLGGADDIAFAGNLLDHVEAQLCIDAKRVFVSGMSNGAAMSSFIACAMPERITAIAPVGATAYPPVCGRARAIPVVSFRGTEDPCVPFDGGTSQCGQKLPVAPVEDVMRNWATHDGCNLDAARERFSAHVRTVSYSECANDTAVVLFVIEGGGHTWPGSIDVPRLGATTHEMNATDEIWRFFVVQGDLRR
jgi:polyhydroxybutyrate depolymerase